MTRLALSLLFCVVLRHYAYHAWGNPAAQSWAFYVLSGVAVGQLCGVLAWVGSEAPGRAGPVVVFGAVWGVAEEAQVAVCGAIQWGQRGSGDVCGRINGAETVYLALASITLAAIITGAIYGRRKSRAG
jgi:hypothetical protein